ncbi:hypothetical protein K503DRAFT_784794 [Rhizopogon vinicolor AM-OR11-026]|uniref:Myb/SANT-like domain-containing protein n=1 Tax=Rhizopogon vinicolor AM-OR11-026 TaxID=1314800 RepID=A0A1B7MTB6_9AGAM|nr:hypothetical protein K503DRAFT_784794 [Rhizopogon vinicolor AM-OR11-026]
MSSENDKDSSDPTAESTAATGKGMKTKKNMPSTSTNTVWKSNDDAMLIATLLKEREEGCQSDSGFEPKSFIACAEALKSSEKMSVWIAKSSGSCHNHWGKLKKDFAVVKKLREQSGFGWDNTLKNPFDDVMGLGMSQIEEFTIAFWPRQVMSKSEYGRRN